MEYAVCPSQAKIPSKSIVTEVSVLIYSVHGLRKICLLSGESLVGQVKNNVYLDLCDAWNVAFDPGICPSLSIQLVTEIGSSDNGISGLERLNKGRGSAGRA